MATMTRSWQVAKASPKRALTRSIPVASGAGGAVRALPRGRSLVAVGAVLVAVGLMIGMSGAFGVGRLLQSILVQSSGRDMPVLLTIALLMIVVAVTACVWPARRATRLNPVAALRYE